MLSKLLFGLHSSQMIERNGNDVWNGLGTFLKEHYSSIGRLSAEESPCGGTLGVLSAWEIDGKKVIAKTHLPEEMGRRNIVKEYMILQSLYGKKIFIDKAEIEVEGVLYSVLLLEKLESPKKIICPSDIKNLLKPLRQNTSLWYEIDCLYRAEDLIIYSKKARDDLYAAGVLSKKLLVYMQMIEPELRSILAGQLVLAHGDLSNPNILCKGDELYLMDWEDAFLCTPDYDFLYWLTFFSQQEFLARGGVERLGIKKRRAEILMMTIVLLKSYIAFLRGTDKNHKVSVNDRLEQLQCLFA